MLGGEVDALLGCLGSGVLLALLEMPGVMLPDVVAAVVFGSPCG